MAQTAAQALGNRSGKEVAKAFAPRIPEICPDLLPVDAVVATATS